jgi:methylated-DNA-protein-cysteine methyltransferase-like protein
MKRETAKRVERILATIRDIPAGNVASYGQVAEIAGVPRGARQVAFALRHVPDGHSVPWHRVLLASGKLAFADNSASFRQQKKRLAAEHVPLHNGRVDMGRYRWQPDLDELLWKPGPEWDEDR